MWAGHERIPTGNIPVGSPWRPADLSRTHYRTISLWNADSCTPYSCIGDAYRALKHKRGRHRRKKTWIGFKINVQHNLSVGEMQNVDEHIVWTQTFQYIFINTTLKCNLDWNTQIIFNKSIGKSFCHCDGMCITLNTPSSCNSKLIHMPTTPIKSSTSSETDKRMNTLHLLVLSSPAIIRFGVTITVCFIRCTVKKKCLN